MSYQELANIAQTWGLIFFLLSFAGVLFYAFRPRSKKLFDDAANIPFKDEKADDAGDLPGGNAAERM